MVSKGQFVGLDWNRIARLHSQVTTGTHDVGTDVFAQKKFSEDIFFPKICYRYD